MRETRGEGAALSSETTPSLDLVFDLLSHSRRRYALYHLNEQPDGVATIEDLAKNVLALERIIEADGETATDQGHAADSTDPETSVRTELQHVHLPKLEDAGIIEHDQRSGTVRYWSQPSVEEWLEHAYHKETA